MRWTDVCIYSWWNDKSLIIDHVFYAQKITRELLNVTDSLNFDESCPDVPSPSVTPHIWFVQSNEDGKIRWDLSENVSY